MARVSMGASAGVQGTSRTPRPQAVSSDNAYGDATQRAKFIVAGLFVLLVVLHSKGS